MHLKERARALKETIPALFLSLKDKDTPLPAKILAGLTVACALSPIDLIPDFIPVLGLLDDLILLPALIAVTIRLIPSEVFRRNLERSAGLWRDCRPRKWFFAIPIVLIWLLLIRLIVKAIRP